MQVRAGQLAVVMGDDEVVMVVVQAHPHSHDNSAVQGICAYQLYPTTARCSQSSATIASFHAALLCLCVSVTPLGKTPLPSPNN